MKIVTSYVATSLCFLYHVDYNRQTETFKIVEKGMIENKHNLILKTIQHPATGMTGIIKI